MLTDSLIKALSPQAKEYRVPDGDGLSLRVKPNGSKIWIAEFRLDGQHIKKSLGTYPDLSLPDARKALIALKAGTAEHQVTFGELFKRWLEFKRPTIKPKTLQAAESRIKTYILPTFRSVPIAAIKAPLLIKALEPLKAQGKHDTVKRTISAVNEVLFWGVNGGLLENNPCAQVTKVFTPPPHTNRPSIGADKLPELFQLIYGRTLARTSRLFVTWSVCSMLRPGENVALQWSWIDWDKKILTLPPEVMKMNREHRVPLTPFMLSLLQEQQDYVSLAYLGSAFVWPADSISGHITSNALSKFLRNNGYRDKLVPHGFRAMARTWLAEHDVDFDVAEACLAHVSGSAIVRAYQRSDFLEKRRQAMQLWCDYVESCIRQGRNAA